MKYLTMLAPVALLFSQVAFSKVNVIDENIDSIPLATINLSNGVEISFLKLPNSDDVVYSELIPVGDTETSFSHPQDGKSLLERYLELTPEFTPIPSAILKLNNNLHPEQVTDAVTPADSGFESMHSKILTRGVVEKLDAPIYRILESVQAKPTVSKVSGGSCGANGRAHFAVTYCEKHGSFGRGTSSDNCDSGAAGTIQRTSKMRARYSWGTTAACGTAGIVKHYKKVSGNYKLVTAKGINANYVLSWYTYSSNSAYRRLRHERVGSSGFIRAWTAHFQYK